MNETLDVSHLIQIFSDPAMTSNVDVNQALDSFYHDVSGINKCKEILDGENMSLEVYHSAANSINMILNNCITNIPNTEGTGLADWILDYTIRRSATANTLVIGELARSFAILLSQFWTTNLSHFKSLYDQLSQFYESDFNGWFIWLLFMREITQTVATIRNKMKTSETFATENWNYIYCSVTFMIQRVMNTNIPNRNELLNSSLEICEILLSYTKNRETSGYGEGKSRRFTRSNRLFPVQNMKATFEEPETICFYFNLYNSTLLDQSYRYTLKCISNIISIASNFFHNYSLNAIINLVVSNIIDILEKETNFSKPGCLYEITNIIAILPTRFNEEPRFPIQTRPNLDIFLERITNLTIAIIQDLIKNLDNSNELAIENLISFWTSIGSILNNSGDIPIKAIARDYADVIATKYIEALIEMINSGNDIEQIIGQETCGSSIIPIHTFFILNPESLLQKAYEWFVQKHQQFNQLIGTNTEEGFIIQKQLAVLTQITCIIITLKPKDQFMQAMIIDVFLAVIQMIQDSITWVQNSIQTYELEESILTFISTFIEKSIFHSNNVSLAINKLYVELSQKQGFANYEQAKLFMHERLILTMKSFQLEKLIKNSIKVLLKDTENPILFEQLACNHTEEDFPFLANADFPYLRTLFHGALTKIFITSSNLHLFPVYLSQFDMYFNAPLTNSLIWGLSLDLYGLFSEIATKEIFNISFDWFFPDRASFFVKAMEAVSDNVDITATILKMWRAIVKPVPSTRIVFSPYTANGIILFKFTAELLVPFLNSVSSYSKDLIYQGSQLRRACQIMGHLFQGDYIVYDAFSIYNDSTYTDILRAFCNIFMNLDWDEMFNYTKLVTSVMNFLSYVCKGHLTVLINLDNAANIIPILIFQASKGVQSPLNEIQNLSIDILSSLGTYLIENSGSDETNWILSNCGGQIQECVERLWTIVVKGSIQLISIARPLSYLLRFCQTDTIGQLQEKLLLNAQPEQANNINLSFAQFREKIDNDINNINTFTALLSILRRTAIGSTLL